MDTSLEDVLGDGPKEEVVAPVVQAEPPVVETPAEPVRDDKGRFAPKGEDAPKQDQLPPEEYKALKDERSKRQTLESELAQIKQQLATVQNPPPPPPDIWEDNQGWQQHFGTQVVETAVQRATLNSKLDMSEMMVRQANPDFEDMKAEFLRLAEENPVLRQQALADPHPWNKAYQIAKNHKAMQELGATDLDGLKAKLREELMAEMAQQQPNPGRPAIPQSLSGERNVGSRSGPAWSGPTSLSDLLG